jgi:hypothetical protein
MWDSIFGSPEEDVKYGMAENWFGQFGLSDPKAIDQGGSAPIYTVRFDDSSKQGQNEHMQELVMLQTEMVALLANILDKKDPDNERTADAMEKLAQISSSSGDVDHFRNSKTGFGEKVTNWWVNK